MARPGKTRFLQLATELAQGQGHDLGRLRGLLAFGYDYPFLLNKKARIEFGPDTTAADTRAYLDAFLRDFYAASVRRIVLQPVKTLPDPAVDVVLEAFANVGKEKLESLSELHRLSMAAENKLGDLLEAYLAQVLEPQGWLWCGGNIMRGVDFFRERHELLQVKNRDNSENSSSSAIRKFIQQQGCPVEIGKWHRIRSRDSVTCWQDLPGNTRLTIADEQRFLAFIRAYIGAIKAKGAAASARKGA